MSGADLLPLLANSRNEPSLKFSSAPCRQADIITAWSGFL